MLPLAQYAKLPQKLGRARVTFALHLSRALAAGRFRDTHKVTRHSPSKNWKVHRLCTCGQSDWNKVAAGSMRVVGPASRSRSVGGSTATSRWFSQTFKWGHSCARARLPLRERASAKCILSRAHALNCAHTNHQHECKLEWKVKSDARPGRSAAVALL